ncbi:uncharacterized protein LOC123558208 [Mercenaria mercenaria]|uniref:uncharacterized protein LOC123558208 n=1 Tax=Mercenaria mercenaria TaxID=6596 RepID=UPI001E1DEB7F|nr:uncharacterized protein LOC123558208 [Mercenaria mercenaria]
MEVTYVQTMEDKTLHGSNEIYNIETEDECLDGENKMKEDEKVDATKIHEEDTVSEVNAQAVDDNILLCNPCLYDDTEEGAVGFCVNCVEYLCQGCCRDHKKSKVTRHHKIIRDNLPKDASIFRLVKEMTSCSDHPDVQVSHKCEDHNAYVCVMCIAGGHRKCEHVTELQNERNNSDIGMMEAAEKISEIQEKSKLVAKSRKENIETLIKEKNKIQETNAALLQQVYDNLSLLEQDAIIMSENVTQSELSYLRKEIDICKDLEKQGFVFGQLLDTAKQHYGSTEFEIITKGIQEKISGIDRVLEKQQQNGEIHLKFKQNPLFNRIQTLGHLKVCRGDTENKTQDIEGSSDEIVEQDDLPLTFSEKKVAGKEGEMREKQPTKGEHKSRKRNKKGKKYSVRFSGDVNVCCISGIIILQDGRVVATDQENRKIKVFSSGDCKQICAHSLEAKPADICKTGPKNFAVVYKDTKLIDRFTVDGKTLKLERSWKTKYLNIGITMDRELYVVLCRVDGNNGDGISIQVRRDTDCKVLLEASVSEGDEGKIDSDECSICSIEGDIIIASKTLGISIFRRNNVESLETIRTLNAYDDTSLNLTGLAVDKDADLYVCSSSSRSVYQISAKEYKLMKPVASGIDGPTAVTVSNKKDRIIVGCQNDNYLHVFNMKQ